MSASCFRRVLALVALGGILLPAIGASAQSTGGVAGVVTVLGSSRPLAGANVTLGASAHSATSDSAGRFRMSGVPAGEYLLTVQRIGFQSVSGRIEVVAGTNVTTDVELEPSAPVRLDEVRVTADSQRRGKLAAMEQRRSIHAGGTFITSAELDSAAGRSLPMLLARKLPGAQITLYPRTGGALLSSGRGRPGRRLPPADSTDPRSPRGCWAQVYVDGVRIYNITYAGLPAPDLRDFRVESLAGIEYYAGEAQTPIEFGGEGAACGTIVLWTK